MKRSEEKEADKQLTFARKAGILPSDSRTMKVRKGVEFFYTYSDVNSEPLVDEKERMALTEKLLQAYPALRQRLGLRT